MDFNLKNYKTIKIKKNIINSKFLVLFNISKPNFEKWANIQKKFTKIKLKFYQIHNKTVIKLLTNSILCNSTNLISSLTLFSTPKHLSTELEIKKVEKQLQPLFIFLFIKLNNKIYYINQVKTLNAFSYNKVIKNFYTQLNKSIKLVYKC